MTFCTVGVVLSSRIGIRRARRLSGDPMVFSDVWAFISTQAVHSRGICGICIFGAKQHRIQTLFAILVHTASFCASCACFLCDITQVAKKGVVCIVALSRFRLCFTSCPRTVCHDHALAAIRESARFCCPLWRGYTPGEMYLHREGFLEFQLRYKTLLFELVLYDYSRRYFEKARLVEAATTELE